MPTAFNSEQIEDILDKYLEPILSFRRTAAIPAKKLAVFSSEEQQFVFHWVKVISATNAELAYQFAAIFSDAYHCFGGNIESIQEWLVDAMAAFDQSGLMLAIKKLQAFEAFSEKLKQKQSGATLNEYKKLLETFVCGLSGRLLELQKSTKQHSYSDTKAIFLPEQISNFSDKETNFLLYKSMLVYHWAENWFGTFREDLDIWAQQFAEPKKALFLLQCFENIRLDNCIKNELPGMHKNMQQFRTEFHLLEKNGRWQTVFSKLRQAKGVQESQTLVKRYLNQLLPVQTIYSGRLYPQEINSVKNQRLADEKTLFKEILGELLAEHQDKEIDLENDIHSTERFSTQLIESNEIPDGLKVELFLDGQLIQPPDNLRSLMESILLDLGDIPPEYLFTAGPGPYRVSTAKKDQELNVWQGIYHEDNAFFYDEWDVLRQSYKQRWCVVREITVIPIYDDFVNQTKTKYMGLVKSLRQTFEVLKGEQKQLKRQVHGDDIDIDAVVESYSDLQAGFEMSERLFTQMQKIERNIAVAFLIDMSGSTEGWINEVERESLVLLCESLEILGDRYAIYGFSGIARKRCEIYRIKDFDESYNEEIKARISGITAKDYTRMGFAIRHLNQILDGVDAKTKLMISLTDGRPEDYDGQYRGEYGIEDTRQALIEAKQKGIHTFCITIDDEAREYLPHMYGSSNYAVINEVSKLPQKVSEIYRKLTA